MKTTYYAIILLMFAANMFGQSGTNSASSVAEEIEKMEAQISNVRAEVSNAIAAQATNGTIDTAAFKRSLQSATNDLFQGHIEDRARVAEAAIRDAQLAVSRLEIGYNTNLVFDTPSLVNRLEVLKGECGALRERISQIDASIGQLEAWANIMKTVLTKAEVTAKLQSRLVELLREWNSAKPISASAATNVPDGPPKNAVKIETKPAVDTASDSRSPILDPVDHKSPSPLGPRHRMTNVLGGDSIATVFIENATGFQVFVTFSSSWQHMWPGEDRAFVAEPGQTITIRLAGAPGEPIFYQASASQNPNIHWASCDCGPDGRLAPLVLCGNNASLRLVQ